MSVVLIHAEAVWNRLFPAWMKAEKPELHRMLTRLAEKVRRANAIQHSGGVITAEDWSELFALQNEAFGVIARAEGRAS